MHIQFHFAFEMDVIIYALICSQCMFTYMRGYDISSRCNFDIPHRWECLAKLKCKRDRTKCIYAHVYRLLSLFLSILLENSIFLILVCIPFAFALLFTIDSEFVVRYCCVHSSNLITFWNFSFWWTKLDFFFNFVFCEHIPRYFYQWN